MRVQGLCVIALAAGVAGNAELPCLVLKDSSSLSAYTQFSAVVTSVCGGNVVTKDVSDASVHLSQYGEFEYSNVLLAVSNPAKFAFKLSENPKTLPVSKSYRSATDEMTASREMESKRSGMNGISANALIEFVDSGRGLLVAVQGGQGVSSELTSFLKEFGFSMEKTAKEIVRDYFGKESELTMSSVPVDAASKLVSGENSGSVMFKGSPVQISATNANVFPILRAGETASHPVAAGSGLVLAAAHQALNGARVTLIGSMEAFSDAAFAASEHNKVFAQNVLSWTFGKRAVIRATGFYHHRVGELEAPRMYTESDRIKVGVKIEELTASGWTPFPATDVQLEYVMLDPYMRQFLKFTGTEHSLEFTAPDKSGVFKFRIDYNRRGYNPIHLEQVAPIRTPRHNDYPRFLFCAYPYYASAFLSLGLVIVFAIVFLNHKEVGKKATGDKADRHRE